MALTRYYWDSVNDNVMKEKDENGDTIATYTHEPGQFGELISQRRDGQTSYYQYDGQGSTRQLTDENGDVTDTYTYSAFGETVAKSGTTTNPFGYIGSRGYYTDAETDEVYVRARVYQPTIGRWLSRDPDSHPMLSNLFLYVANNPATWLDPSGYIETLPDGTIITDDGSVITPIVDAKDLDDWFDFGSCDPRIPFQVIHTVKDWTVTQTIPDGMEPCTNRYRIPGCGITRVSGWRRCSKKVQFTFQRETTIRMKCDCEIIRLPDPLGEMTGTPGGTVIIRECKWKITDIKGKPKVIRKEFKRECGECKTPFDGGGGPIA